VSEWFLNDRPSKTFPLYSRANVGEVFPDPITPLNATAGFLANLEPGWRDAYVTCRVWDHDLYDEAVDHNPLVCFGGYLFINMSLMRLFGVRVPGFSPEAVDLQYFGDMPGIPSYESEQRPFDESEEWSAKAGEWLVAEVLGATDLRALDAQRTEVRGLIDARPDLGSLSDEDLVQRISSWAPLFRRLFEQHIVASLKAGIGLGALAQVCEAVGRPDLSLTLAQGIGDVDSAGPSLAIWDLGRKIAASPALSAAFDIGAGPDLLDRLRKTDESEVRAFVRDVDQFLEAWAFRGPNEWELRSPTWGTAPELALTLIDRVRLADAGADPNPALERGGSEREAAATEVRALLAGNDEALGQFEAALHASALWCRGRERQRSTTAMLVHEQRLAADELGRRGVAAGHLDNAKQIYMLTIDELGPYVAAPARFTEQVRERETAYLDLFDLEPPFVVAGSPPPLSEWKRKSTTVRAKALRAGGTLQGVPGCPGVARGLARVVLDPSDPSQLEVGEILIAPITDPSWTPLFMAAAAVVVGVGSPFSHAAIVSRELGIPCVVSAGDCTNLIPTGVTVEVDGTHGTVTVIE
jgi:phosphohistidine swiveling domain-containing protein